MKSMKELLELWSEQQTKQPENHFKNEDSSETKAAGFVDRIKNWFWKSSDPKQEPGYWENRMKES